MVRELGREAVPLLPIALVNAPLTLFRTAQIAEALLNQLDPIL